MVTNDEIKKTHSQGFGGSDAKMFAKIGRQGIESLSTTEIKRILVVLGRREMETFEGNVYTVAGHMFEDWIADNINGDQQFEDDINLYDREALITQRTVNGEPIVGIAPHNFTVFAHADFCLNEHSGYILECKYSQDDTDKVRLDYFAQLQWYYFLGVTDVRLVHGWGNVLPFDVHGYIVADIDMDDDTINAIADGVAALDAAIDNGYFEAFDCTDIMVAELSDKEKTAIATLTAVTLKMKELETAANDARQALVDAMEKRGVLSITGDNFKVTYVAPTTRRTFDTKKAQAAFPELANDEYYKVSNVKSTIKMTTK